jgi:hypothetical protein
MTLSIGQLINKFDNLDTQNVGTFNELFEHCRLGRMTQTIDGIWEFIEYPTWWSVEILTPETGNCRRIILNGKEIIHHMPFSLRSKQNSKGRFKAVIVDGKKFESTRAACNHYKLSTDQFKTKFNETSEGIYERRVTGN